MFPVNIEKGLKYPLPKLRICTEFSQRYFSFYQQHDLQSYSPDPTTNSESES
jgi:hypothetical protein